MSKTGVWLVGTAGGEVSRAGPVAQDLVALTAWFAKTKAEVQWITGRAVRQAAVGLDPAMARYAKSAWPDSREAILKMLEAARAYSGDRRVWIGGPAVVADEMSPPGRDSGARFWLLERHP